MRYVIPLLLAAAPALAETCPPADPQVERHARIIDELRAAPGEREARRIAQELWVIWLNAPDERAQELLDAGMEGRGLFDFEASEAALTALIEYCPDYAEGWNQRAFGRFLSEDYEGALSDLDRAIELSPAHVAALAGKALTLFGMERNEEGQAVLRSALALNPWLSERHLLDEGPGQDL